MSSPKTLLADLRVSLTAASDAALATPMSAYMKHRYEFLGVAAQARRRAQRPVLAALAGVDGKRLLAFARACWKEPHREFQYVATDALGRHQKVLTEDDLPTLGTLVTTHSWWDTVDALAAHPIGGVVLRCPGAARVMDAWIEAENLWLVRAALLHQLRYRERTDRRRLFAYADRWAGESDFFIRKAIGWALRQYARTDPNAVRSYVASRADQLSGLTRREALKHL